MEHPYTPPESDLSTNENSIKKRSLWWKVYFFIITGLSTLGLVEVLSSDGAGFIDYLALVFFLIATAGLFGFVFSKKVLFPKFWLPFLIIYIVQGLLYESLSGVDLRAGMTNNEYYTTMVIGYLIALPAYYGVFQFSKGSRYPWTDA